MKLTLVRHGQSEGNAAHLWQGSGDSPLTARGREQARALAPRLNPTRFDQVFTSNLQRARDTGRIAGFDPIQMPSFAEMELGRWEGLTFTEVADRYADELAALRSGEDVALGVTGETGEEFAARVAGGIEKITANADGDESFLLFIHGGTINAIIRHLLGMDRTMFQVFGAMMNTGVCQIEIDETGHAVLETYNDAGHVGPVSDWASNRLDDGAVLLDLIRHGVTQANKERRVQGQLDWGLHPDGEAQAAALSTWIGDVDRVYASSSGRASDTARIAFGTDEVVELDDLREIHMGDWQGQTWDELIAMDPGIPTRIESADTPRGGHGESMLQLRERVTSVIDGLLETTPSGRIAAVSHGGTLGAYFRHLIGDELDGPRRIGRLDNTAVSQVVVGEHGPMISSFNVTYHLDQLDQI